ncbi:MAG: hypothetical protein JEZ06_21745 [Anaerolineaceae bacterium]|nr:hypothetical protein [Anaerolineaceae bacterium]
MSMNSARNLSRNGKTPIDQDNSSVIGVRKKNEERSTAYERRGEIACPAFTFCHRELTKRSGASLQSRLELARIVSVRIHIYQIYVRETRDSRAGQKSLVS